MAGFASSPLAAGVGLVALGAVLHWLKPGALDMPKPSRKASDSPKFPRNKREVRDGVALALPENMTDAVARTCFLVGGGLLVLRALDAFMEDQDRLFASSDSLKEIR